jgi:hypothetical protein
MPGTVQPGMPDQTLPDRAQQQQLEERLRRGEMNRSTPQGEISDRLDQLHEGTAEPGETPFGQSNR